MFKKLVEDHPAFKGSPSQQLLYLLLAGAASSVVVSIAASQILLFGAVLVAGGLWARGYGNTAGPHPIFWPLIAFFLWTLIAAFASSDTLLGLLIVKKFSLFLMLFLVPLVCQVTGRIRWIYGLIFAVSLVSSLKGMLQYAADPKRDLLHRISGFMSQWMTYSGLLMLVLVALVAYLACFGWRRHWWIIPLSLLTLAPLILSETRNAWLGALAGVLVVLALKIPRAIVLALALVVLFFLLAPARVQQRLRSGWNPDDPNTRNRIELFGTALRLIRDNPWFGVGPKNVEKQALRYRGSEKYPDWLYQHMHNNFLQIAAERGIPGLLLWLWFMGRLVWDSFKVFRRARSDCAGGNADAAAQEACFAAAAALGAWIALMVAGLFEYNFGDSEVLTLFLFMMSAPYAFLSAKESGSASAKTIQSTRLATK
jgi:putative inorganic carbon (HCO3(-)) transporter